MTRITLTRRAGHIVRVEAEGHSDYADAGEDIVCAAVTASFRLMCAQLEARGIGVKVLTDDRRAYLSLEAEAAEHIFAGFEVFARELCEEYPENISVTEVEQNA